MIEELAITDLGVISSARIEPGPGLTVITGETGAGKTMVLSGLDLILGRKADSGAVRPGAESATAEGRLVPPEGHPSVQVAVDAGALLDDGALLVARTVNATGRSRAYLGGRSVPAGLLTEVGESLVTVHGQADQQRLRSVTHQRDALDDFAGHHALRAAYTEAFRRAQRAARELQEWDADQGRRAAELEHLERAVEQIDALELQPGEDQALRTEAERLGNVEELRIAAAAVGQALSGTPEADEPTVLALLEGARRHLQTAAAFDETLQHWAEQLDQASYLLSDLSTEAADYTGRLEADPGRLEYLHQRRARIADLAREFLPAPGAEQDAGEETDTADLLLRFSRQAHDRIGDLTAPGAGRDRLVQELEQAQAETDRLAGELTRSRQAAAEAMCSAVTEELTALAMSGAQLHVQIEPRSEPAEHGADEIRFLLTAHPGAPARPLGKGASGGELSRVMLALEVALARARAGQAEPLPAFVFDEIDAGVGGRAAVEVGRRLAELARHTQVIVITHLAQVAAFAEKHLVVTKRTEGQSVTNSDIEHVEGERRETELARMLSGEEDSDAARQHAAELLARTGVPR